MKNKTAVVLLLVLLFILSACGAETQNAASTQERSAAADGSVPAQTETKDEGYSSQKTENISTTQQEKSKMQLTIGNQNVTVAWADNPSVEALAALCERSPLTIPMSMYGGFEQVGSIGANLPRDDKQTTTSAGDIVLYSGDQIVIFYGSNSWAYTRLGKITGLSGDDLVELLGNGDVTLTISSK